MDIKIDICRNAEWDPSYYKKIILTEDDQNEIENALRDNLNIDDEYSLFIYGQSFYEKKEYETAFHYFEIMSNRGLSQAKYQAAVMLYDGLGTPRNKELAFKMMLELAKSEDFDAKHLIPAANFNVGRAYFLGDGVAKNEKLGEKHLKMAADYPEQNLEAAVQAQMSLGLMYGTPEYKNLEQSFKYHKLAASQGALESIGILGVMYLNGQGVVANINKGFENLLEASSQGNVYAKGMLVKFYYRRKLYTKCIENALDIINIHDIALVSQQTTCVEKFIKIGISIACFIYARCLDQGLGVKKDEKAAKKYYSKSFDHDKKICFELQKKILHGLI